MSERDIHREAQKFRDHWCATPGAKGTKLDWPATWRNWIRREMSDPRRLRVVNGTNGHQPKRLTDEEVASGLYDTY
jgi:vancomycin resistance protein YoaR